MMEGEGSLKAVVFVLTIFCNSCVKITLLPVVPI
jgi:hypothetical protein